MIPDAEPLGHVQPYLHLIVTPTRMGCHAIVLIAPSQVLEVANHQAGQQTTRGFLLDSSLSTELWWLDAGVLSGTDTLTDSPSDLYANRITGVQHHASSVV